MQVSFSPADVCWREYEPFTVLYDLRSRQILTLENVAADIWHKIANEHACEIDDVVEHIAQEYDCDIDDAVDDVCAFVDELYEMGVLRLDGSFKETKTVSGSYASPDDDIEGEIIRSLEPFDQLYSATFEMTYACNENCVHCYAHFPGAAQPHKPSAPEIYRKAIDELHEMGCMHLAFTGGDPFIHREFPDVFFYARERGFVCDVYTNGLYLYDNDELLERMAEAQPRAFFISLYGSKPDIHDSVTRKPGSFDKTLHVVKRLRELDVPVVLNVMLLSINHLDLPNIVALAKGLGVEYRASMSLIMRNDGSDKPMDFFIGDKAAIKTVISTIRRNFFSIDVPASEFERTEYMCGAGVTSISIDPEGYIHPCVSLKSVLGYICTGTIRQAWNSSRRQDVAESLRWDSTKECMSCKSRDYCPHCPGMSQAESGDIFACNTCDKIVSECIMEIDS
ncbi:radical SAM protein [Enterorhabdus sp. NM05_H27]|nr:radical SAM protein [Enterorhabdus sp. NM05_H27]